ncbi:HTH-type transcriptional regulator TtgR [compost metagenome]
MPEDLDTARAAVSIHAYIDGLLYQWLLAPDSFELHTEAERWVDIALDMLRFSPSLRK